jgi:hypothetical protein
MNGLMKGMKKMSKEFKLFLIGLFLAFAIVIAVEIINNPVINTWYHVIGLLVAPAGMLVMFVLICKKMKL